MGIRCHHHRGRRKGRVSNSRLSTKIRAALPQAFGPTKSSSLKITNRSWKFSQRTSLRAQSMSPHPIKTSLDFTRFLQTKKNTDFTFFLWTPPSWAWAMAKRFGSTPFRPPDKEDGALFPFMQIPTRRGLLKIPKPPRFEPAKSPL